jgi:glutathione S-transferase
VYDIFRKELVEYIPNTEMTAKRNSTLPQGMGVDLPRVICRARFPGKDQPPKELHYFCLQVLGELPRLLLEVSQTPYDSIMYFAKGEYKEFAPFGQLPVYKDPELGGLLIAQSDAICNHISREAGLTGSTITERALQDMAWQLAKDISGKKEAIHSAEPLDPAYAALLEGAVKLLQHSKGPYITGENFGYGDIGLFHSLFTLEEIKPGFLNPWTELGKFLKAVGSITAINHYLKSPRRVPLTQNEVGKGNTGIAGFTYLKPLNPNTIKEAFDKSNL